MLCVLFLWKKPSYGRSVELIWEIKLCVWLIQAVLAVTVTYTAKATAWTPRRWALLCSTTVWAAELASSSSALTIRSGAIPVVRRSSSPPRTFALRTTLFRATMAAGATLPVLISTSPCLCSSRSPSTEPELFPSLIAGKENTPFSFLSRQRRHFAILDELRKFCQTVW